MMKPRKLLPCSPLLQPRCMCWFFGDDLLPFYQRKIEFRTGSRYVGREITRSYSRNQNIIKKEGPDGRLQFLSARNVLVSFDLGTYLAQQYSITELQPTSCYYCHHSPSSLPINELASFPLTTKRCFRPLVIVVIQQRSYSRYAT